MKSSVVRLSVAVVAASLMVVALPAPLATAAGPFQFHSLTPCRVVDTRAAQGPALTDSGPIGSAPRNFSLQGFCGVPVGAKAITLNVTAIGPTGLGFLTLFPQGTTQPVVSNLNYNAGEPALGNGAIVPVGAAVPDLSVFTRINPAPGSAHMTIDITGYFQ